MRESVNSKIQLENVLFKTRNLLLVKVGTKKNKSRTAYIVCEGVSLSVDKYNVPYLWDPYLSIPNEKEFKGILQGDIFLMYFPQPKAPNHKNKIKFYADGAYFLV